MVVIPARNEEAFIARAVASLPHDSVIVVDDHSADATAEEARSAGAGVLPAPDLSRGMAGKSTACLAGARALTSRWILFADADTHFSKGFLDAAVGFAQARDISLLSIYLHAECATLAERVLAPYLIALFFCGTMPRRDPRTVFNGQCLLVRRDAYQFLGGHATALTGTSEDIRLAALARRHRLRVGVVRGGEWGSVRFRDVPRMVERGARRFMLVSPWMGVSVLAAAFAMAAWLPVLVWLIAGQNTGTAIAFAALPFALVLSWYWSSLRGAAILSVLAFPVAIYIVLPWLTGGFVKALLGRPVEWKGREID